MEKIIEFKDVSKTYDSETHALNDVNIVIEKGEFAFIVGASGAGKSTFLKLIMHEETPSKGTIIVNGTNVTKLKRRKIPYLRRNMGIVFQDFRLIEKMTVYDNVAFAMRAIGASPAQVKERVPYILDLVGLAHKLKSRPSELSGGEQQRVSLARALVNKPAIIIADEPTGNIDPEMSYEIIELLTKINADSGTTILVVTHEHELVKQFDKRVIEIEKGHIVNDTKDSDFSFEDFNSEINENNEAENDIPDETSEENASEASLDDIDENEEEPEETSAPAEGTDEPVTDENETGNAEDTTEEMTPQEILAALAETKNSEIDEASVDEVLAEIREISESKGGED